MAPPGNRVALRCSEQRPWRPSWTSKRSIVQPNRDWSSPQCQLWSRLPSGCSSRSWSQASAPNAWPGVTVAVASDKFGLAGTCEAFGQPDGQGRGPIHRQVVEADELDQAAIEARLEHVVAVAPLAGLRIQRHTPHVIGTA